MHGLKRLARKLLDHARYHRAKLQRPNHTLFGASTDYQKFVLLSAQRCGSNWMMATLRGHPEIASFGELFVKTRVDFEIDGFDIYSEEMRYLRNRYPLEFLNQYIFSGYRPDIKAVGFKLFPEAVLGGPCEPVLDWLRRSTDTKVAIMFRRNLLASYLSLVKAKQSGVWIVTDGASAPARGGSSKHIALDYDDCRAFFEERKRIEAAARDLARGREVFDVSYEDLVREPTRLFHELQQWLGVTPLNLSPATEKQEAKPLHEVISNYADLQKRFAGSEWSEFFVDG